MGWYAMALIETLDFIALEHPRRRELIAILQRLAEAVTKVQAPKSGVWWQVVDQGGREGNYLEASVSTMFTFALLKAARLGYIDTKYRDAGRGAYAGVLTQFIEVGSDGLVTSTTSAKSPASAAIRKRGALSRRNVRLLRDREDPRQRSEGRGFVHFRESGDGAMST